MDKEIVAVGVKSTAAGIGATAMTIGLEGVALAIAAAFLGAIASLHFEPPAAGSKVWQVALRVFALAFMGMIVGLLLPKVPTLDVLADTSWATRSGLVALFANPINSLIRWFIARKSQGG
jgi:hypothetical protein